MKKVLIAAVLVLAFTAAIGMGTINTTETAGAICEACGTWRVEEAGYYEEITLNPDGTCLLQSGDESGTLSAEGEWFQVGDETTISTRESDLHYRLRGDTLYGPINEPYVPSKTYKK